MGARAALARTPACATPGGFCSPGLAGLPPVGGTAAGGNAMAEARAPASAAPFGAGSPGGAPCAAPAPPGAFGAQVWGQKPHNRPLFHIHGDSAPLVPETGTPGARCHAQGCHSRKRLIYRCFLNLSTEQAALYYFYYLKIKPSKNNQSPRCSAAAHRQGGVDNFVQNCVEGPAGRMVWRGPALGQGPRRPRPIRPRPVKARPAAPCGRWPVRGARP